MYNVCVTGLVCVYFFFKQKTAYEMRISDWSSDVCSSDLLVIASAHDTPGQENRDCRRRHRRMADRGRHRREASQPEDRKSVAKGKRVSVRVDLGGCCTIKKNIRQYRQKRQIMNTNITNCEITKTE